MLKWLAIWLRELAELSKSENLYDAIYFLHLLKFKNTDKKSFLHGFLSRKRI